MRHTLNIGKYQIGDPEMGSLVFESNPEATALFPSGDTVGIHLPGSIKYQPRMNRPIAPFYPVVLEMHGILYQGQTSTGLGATLLPVEMPSFQEPLLEHAIAFTFMCTRRFLQEMEDRRAAQPQQSMILGFTLQGTAAIVLKIADKQTAQGGTPQPARIGDSDMIGLGQIARIGNSSGSGDSVTISRSHWTDSLEHLGYPQNRSIELPTIDATRMVPELQNATQLLQRAFALFADDNYRQAVQMCRQVRDALLPGENPEQRRAWVTEHLAPIIGTDKATMVYSAVDALRTLGNSASHGSEKNIQIEVDRDVAEYTIGQLTLTLHYLDRKLR